MLDHITIDLQELSRARQRRVREALAREGADVLVVGSPENVLYVTGYESMAASINRRHDFAAIVTAAQILLVCPAIDLAAAVGGGMAREDVFPFGTFFFAGAEAGAHMAPESASFAEAFEKAMARVNGKRLLVEGDCFPASARHLLPGDCDTDGGRFMLRVRSVKLPGELVLMRHATRITQQAIAAGMAAAKVGVTDKQVASVVAATMSAGGGFTRNVTVVGGLHSAFSDAMPAGRPLAEGDLLRFDVGCSYLGYKSDMARTGVMGRPTALQADRYDALREALEDEFAAIRPGVAAGDVFAAGMRRIEACGFDGFRRHHLGHAIGLAVYEWPVITPGNAEPVAEGSVYCLETPYYEPGWGGMMCEDTGVVTADGFDLMSDIDRALWELG